MDAWIDSHCHLDSLEDHLGAMARARAAGVGAVVTVGDDIASSAAAVSIADAHEDVFAVVGIHPYHAEAGQDLAAIEALAGGKSVVAIGEIGLDFHRPDPPGQAQKELFKRQLGLAEKLGLPIVLHVREAFDEVVEILAEVDRSRGVMFHCFSGGADEARAAAGLGGHVSFAGNVSFRNADTLRAAAAVVPRDRLLVETDSPYLSPVPLRGKPNEPANVVHVGAAVAAARGESPDDVRRSTSSNASRFFGLGL